MPNVFRYKGLVLRPSAEFIEKGTHASIKDTRIVKKTKYDPSNMSLNEIFFKFITEKILGCD